jgi:outer membrane protein assembly factor BamB
MNDTTRGPTAAWRLGPALAVAIFLGGCGGGGDSTPADATADPPVPAPTSVAANFQGDASHSGVAAASTPSFPLRSAWQRTFAGNVSYPLIAENKVFVITSGSGYNVPTQLVAVDQESGFDAWPAVTIGSAYGATLAYDGGRVFVVASDNILRSFDAATGAPAWSTLLPSYQGAPPTAHGGKVYVAAGSSVFAVDARSGAILWSLSTLSQSSSPALGAADVFWSSMCDAFALVQASGQERWRIGSGPACGGGLTASAVYAGGRLYLRNVDITTSQPTLVVRDGATGALLGNANVFSFYGYFALPPPAVTRDAAYVMNAGSLQRLDPLLKSAAWSFAGDGSLTSAPLVIGDVVLVGGYSGKLYAVDAASGSERWSALLPAEIQAPNDAGFTSSVTGLAAANGLLAVPAGRTLNAWRLTPP